MYNNDEYCRFSFIVVSEDHFLQKKVDKQIQTRNRQQCEKSGEILDWQIMQLIIAGMDSTARGKLS